MSKVGAPLNVPIQGQLTLVKEWFPLNDHPTYWSNQVNTNKLCILVEGLFKNNCLLQFLSRALAFKFNPGATQ